MRFLSLFLLIKAIFSKNRGKLFIAGYISYKDHSIILYLANFKKIKVSLQDLLSIHGGDPGFIDSDIVYLRNKSRISKVLLLSRFSIINQGTTISFGNYEIETSDILSLI